MARTPLDDHDARLDADVAARTGRGAPRLAALLTDAAPLPPPAPWVGGGGAEAATPPSSPPWWETESTPDLRARLRKITAVADDAATLARTPDGGAKLAANAARVRTELAKRKRVEAERAAAAAAAARAAAAAPPPLPAAPPADLSKSKQWLAHALGVPRAREPRPRAASAAVDGALCALCGDHHPAAAMRPLASAPATFVDRLAGAGVDRGGLACSACWRDNLGGGPSTRLGGLGLPPPPATTRASRGAGEPITLSSSDDDDESGAAAAAAAACSPRPGSSDSRRSRRRASRTGGTAAAYAGLTAVWPPAAGPGAVTLGAADLACLDDEAMLNDTIIDLHMKRIEQSIPDSHRFHFFSSFFYKKLLQKAGAGPGGLAPGGVNHAGVASWTRGVDVFARDFLLIPVHDALHWSLVIVCYPWAVAAGGGARGGGAPAPLFLHLDSMRGAGGHRTASVSKTMRSYLAAEWAARAGEAGTAAARAVAAAPSSTDWPRAFHGNTFPTKAPPVPAQDNAVDCGLMLLIYADYFCAQAPRPPHGAGGVAAAAGGGGVLSPASAPSPHPPADPARFYLTPSNIETLWREPGTPRPGFLHRAWFAAAAAPAGLRLDLREFVLDAFVQAARAAGGAATESAAVVRAVAALADLRASGRRPRYRAPGTPAALDDARAAVERALAPRGRSTRGAGAAAAAAPAPADRAAVAAAAEGRRRRTLALSDSSSDGGALAPAPARPPPHDPAAGGFVRDPAIALLPPRPDNKRRKSGPEERRRALRQPPPG